jgi:S1-C subfamily serine protease
MISTHLTRAGTSALLILLGSAGFTAARAASVQELNASYTVGTQGSVAINQFAVSGPGTVSVSLAELAWPEMNLADLSFELKSSNNQVIGMMTAAGTESFSLTSGGMFYALSYGQANPVSGGFPLPYGSYGVTVNYVPAGSPVALPASLWLLLSGVAGLGASQLLNGRRRLRLVGPPATAL